MVCSDNPLCILDVCSSYANCVGLKAMNSKYSMQIPSGIPPAMHSEAFIAEFESYLNKFFRKFILKWRHTSCIGFKTAKKLAASN